MDDLPVLKKCCFCVPLRYGLLIWGYLKLVIAVKVLSFLIILVVALSRYMKGDNFMISVAASIFLILITEIVFHIIFIIGAHKKNVELIKLYYYYALFMWVATIVISFLVTALLVISNSSQDLFFMDALGFLFSIVVQTFLVLSLRSEIIKLRSNCPYKFVKNENDPEGTIYSVPRKDDEEMYIDNGTVRIM